MINATGPYNMYVYIWPNIYRWHALLPCAPPPNDQASILCIIIQPNTRDGDIISVEQSSLQQWIVDWNTNQYVSSAELLVWSCRPKTNN